MHKCNIAVLFCFSYTLPIAMALTPAEKQRRYRQRLKEDPVKDAEADREDLLIVF